MSYTLREIIEEQMPLKVLIAVIVIIAVVVGYGLWTTTNAGTLLVESPAYGAQVFIDQHPAGTLHEPPDSLRLSESSGKHNVIVSKEGYWPWIQNIDIKKHETIELHPFIVPQKIGLENITRLVYSNGTTRVAPEYEKTAPLFENLTISDEVKPLVEATRILGVTYADYTPGRTDVILVTTKDGIFAVGIEKNDRPNLQPVYKSANAMFAKDKDGALYIKDGDSIFHAKGLGK